MPINPGDFVVTILPTDDDINYLECVVGSTLTLSVEFKNLSTTDPLYNLDVTISLPNGLSYVSADTTESSNIIDSSYNNVVSFVNIKDLYPLEVDYKFNIIVRVDLFKRGTGANVPFNTIIPGIFIEASCDTKPRGYYDAGNSVILSSASISMKPLRFQAIFNAPSRQLKGAGSSPSLVNPTQAFIISVTLDNNTRTQSNISLTLSLANGLRYLNAWSSSGTNAAEFSNPIITPISSTNNNVKVQFTNKPLTQGSLTTFSFEVAIWDKYTVNGIENSGNTIIYGDILTSSITITGNNSSYTESWKLNPLEINIVKTVSSPITDVNVTNEFQLTYQTSEYITTYNTEFYDILPDGISFTSANITPDTIISNVDGTTSVGWMLNTLSPNSSGNITLFATTNVTYINNAYVYSGDELTNMLSFIFQKVIGSDFITAYYYLPMKILTPIISKTITGYYYENLTPKTFEIAAIGDFVEFNIVYDARGVVAKQKNVIFYDYPPLNMYTPTLPAITITGDFPTGAVSQLAPDNGYRVLLGNLNGGIYFTMNAKFQVNPGPHHEFLFNLCKFQLLNSKNNSISVRDQALIIMGTTHIFIDPYISSSSCLALNSSKVYSLTIKNVSNDEIDYAVDGFNLNLVTTIPSLYTIGTVTISTGINYSNFSIVDNVLSLIINKLPPSSALCITIPLSVDTVPIMGEPYNLITSVSNGTSQASTTSYYYDYNDYPLDSMTNLSGCLPTIWRKYTPNICYLGDYFNSYAIVTIPQGILSYNNKIKLSLFSTNSQYLSNVLLNGVTVPYTLSSNNMQVLLPEVLNTEASEVVYILTNSNRIMNAAPINYQDDLLVPCSIDWSNEPVHPEVYNVSHMTPFTILTPGMSLKKYQRNVTENTTYDTIPIYARDNDVINYKLQLKNIGKAPAFNVILIDTLPVNVQATSIVGATSYSYNNISKVVTCQVNNIYPNSIMDILITSKVLSETLPIITTNTASLVYKANPTFPANYGGANSNTVLMYKENLVITKFQRNVSTGDAFTTSEIRCMNDQTIQYKLSFTNTTGLVMSNIVIDDIFPNAFSYVSHEPFTMGTIVNSGNKVTCTISLLPVNGTVEYIYTVKLNSTAFMRVYSQATSAYNHLGGLVTFYKNSNKAYVVCSALGKGFKVY